MKVGELKKLIEFLDDDDFILVDIGSRDYYKIRNIDDTTNVGVYRIRVSKYKEGDNFYE